MRYLIVLISLITACGKAPGLEPIEQGMEQVPYDMQALVTQTNSTLVQAPNTIDNMFCNISKSSYDSSMSVKCFNGAYGAVYQPVSDQLEVQSACNISILKASSRAYLFFLKDGQAFVSRLLENKIYTSVNGCSFTVTGGNVQ